MRGMLDPCETDFKPGAGLVAINVVFTRAIHGLN